MKSIKLTILLLSLLTVIVLPQIRTLPTEDHFNYPLGNLGDTYPSSGWLVTRGYGDNPDLFVVANNLTYSNYPMAASGNQIQLSITSDDDYTLQFTNVSNSKIYVSFLLNVSNSSGLEDPPNGGVFAGLGNISNTFASARVWIRNGSITGTYFNLGLSKNNNEKFGFSGDLTIGQTYLVVIGYEVVDGPLNDIASLWIDPDLSGPEPSTIVSGIGTANDTDSINAFFLRQSPTGPNAFIDALRIGTSWVEAPLPVELSSLSAAVVGSSVKLNWRTETEINNYGFEIERKIGNGQPLVGNYETIGFVNGNGNSNSPKNYTFEDNSLLPGKYSYRLKQIDNDGQFEYSKTIQVDFNSPKKFELTQNYPNPFNPVTTISWEIPKEGLVTLKIYDILGKEIYTIADEYQQAGSYQRNFDGSSLSSGMYFFTLQSGSFVEIRKMILIK